MTEHKSPSFILEHKGVCPICEAAVVFQANAEPFRSNLKCSGCGSVPRHRAVMRAILTFCPNWKTLRIHESSPGWDPLSAKLVAGCPAYKASQYDTSVSFGSTVHAPRTLSKQYQSENLESQTFQNESFDLVVTQDVFEHIFAPDLAIKEIARTLAPGGVVVMSVPMPLKNRPSRRRACVVNGDVKHILPADFHGNPMGGGSLVTVDWGYDLAPYLQHYSGLAVMLLSVDDLDAGIRADLNEVIVGFKQPLPAI